MPTQRDVVPNGNEMSFAVESGNDIERSALFTTCDAGTKTAKFTNAVGCGNQYRSRNRDGASCVILRDRMNFAKRWQKFFDHESTTDPIADELQATHMHWDFLQPGGDRCSVSHSEGIECYCHRYLFRRALIIRARW